MKKFHLSIVILFLTRIVISQNYLDTLLDFNGISEEAFNMVYVNDSVIQINTSFIDPSNSFDRGISVRNINLNTIDVDIQNYFYGQVTLPLGFEGGCVKSLNSDTTFLVYSPYSPYSSDSATQDAYLAAVLNTDTLWTKNLGVVGFSDYFSSIDCFEDSLLILGGGVKNDIGLYDFRFVITDRSGNIILESEVGGSGEDIVLSMTKFTDTSYLLSGFTQSSEFGITGISDFYLVEFSLEGDVLWSHNYGDFERVGGFVNSTSDGNIMVYGFALNDFNNGQFYYAKLSHTGSVIWENTLDNDVYNNKSFSSFQEVSDGYVFIGSCPDPDNQEQVGYIVKTDFDGNVLWNRKYKRRENGNYFRDILPSDDGGFYVLGFVYPDVIDPNITTDAWLLKLNCLGFKAPPVSEFTYGLDNDYTVQFLNTSENFGTCKFIYGDGIEETFTENDPKFISHTYSNSGVYEVSLITYGCNEESDTISYTITPSILSTDEILDKSSFDVYPNPTKTSITVSHRSNMKLISILDLNGKVLLNDYVSSNSTENVIDISDFEKGVYIVKLSNESSGYAKRVIKQ